MISNLISAAELWFQLWQDDEVELFSFLDQLALVLYVPWNVYWVDDDDDDLIIISNIIIARAANTPVLHLTRPRLSYCRTVGHHLMDAFSWLDHPWLGRPMRHKAIFHRNVCFNSREYIFHHSALSPGFQNSLMTFQCSVVWTFKTCECEAAGSKTHESLRDLAPCISQNCEILFSE